MKKFLTIMMVMLFLAPALQSSAQQRSSESTFFYDFDNNSLEGWTVIDLDEDGSSWMLSEEGYIYSESANAKPNNIIATTEKYAIYAGSKISFDVRPSSTVNFAENYGIAYSLEGEFFYTIHNVTLESSEDWVNVEFVLNYCEGKEIYIGILHNSIDNQSAIFVDNVKLTDGRLPKPVQVAAVESENNVNITWGAPLSEDAAYEHIGYRLYKTSGTDNGEIIANNITETSYQDASWSNTESGVYKWGVAALYNEITRGGTETLLEEGFEESTYPNIPTEWTEFADPSNASTVGNWMTNTAIGTLVGPSSGSNFVFSFGGYAENAEYYLVTPAIDLSMAMNPSLNFSYVAPGPFEDPGDPLYVRYSESPTGPWTEIWTEIGNFAWKNVSIDLTAASGKTIYLAFVHKDLKNFGVGLDDITITTSMSDEKVPVASDIVWSNTIDKDMTTTVNIKVTANNNKSVAGATVTLANVNETAYTYEATLDETGEYQWTDVRKGNYEYVVSLNGYYPTEEEIEISDATNIYCTLEAMPEVIEGLYVSPTAWAMWDFEGESTSYNVRLNGELVATNVNVKHYQHNVKSLKENEEYTTTVIPTGQTEYILEYTWTYKGYHNFASASEFKVENQENSAVLTWSMPEYEPEADPVYEFSSNFDNGSLQGWTTIDGDGDGRNWQNTSEFANQGFGIDNTFCAASISFDNEDGAINPNNFLVTDQKYAITAGSKLRFSIAAQSKTSANEHYGIAITTKKNASANDFTTIFEETLTAGEVEDSVIQGQWFEKEIDLSAYEGQNIYIAVRHFNSPNQFWIKLDNVSLTSSAKRADEDGEWLFYDNGTYESATGNFNMDGSTQQLFWAIMFPADIISDYAGKTLTKVSMYDCSAHKGAFSIHTGGDTAPGMMVHVQSYETTGVQDFVEFELDTPITISGKDNVWIQFSNEYGSGDFVAAYCQDTGDPNSRWRSDNGSYWYDSNWYGEGWYGTWLIRAFVGNETAIPDTPQETTTEPIGTMIFRNGELITPEPITETSYTDVLAEDENEVEYSIRVVYGGEKDKSYYAMSCPLTQKFVVEEPLACTPPQKLYGETTLNEDGTFGTTLVWPYVKEWLYYDNGEPEMTIGLGGNMYWGVMFTAEDLAAYAGSYLTKVALCNGDESGEATLTISYGGDKAPGENIHSQKFTFQGKEVETIFEVELTSPIPVMEGENIWITVYQNGMQYPAVSTKSSGNPNGRWLSVDGVDWYDIVDLDANYDLSWFMRAYVSNEAKGGIATEINYDRNESELDHYNIYRSTTNGNYTLIAETTDNKYFDEVERGTYYYQVTAVYKRGDETCESEPATSYNDATANYVVVEVTAIDENGVKGMMIYPNPTKDNLNIIAENMKRITIVNTLGQVVYDRNANSDNEIINMAQYEAGIYMVRIVTENGITTKRISVVR